MNSQTFTTPANMRACTVESTVALPVGVVAISVPLIGQAILMASYALHHPWSLAMYRGLLAGWLVFSITLIAALLYRRTRFEVDLDAGVLRVTDRRYFSRRVRTFDLRRLELVDDKPSRVAHLWGNHDGTRVVLVIASGRAVARARRFIEQARSDLSNGRTALSPVTPS